MLEHIGNLLSQATIQILDKQYTPIRGSKLQVRLGSGRQTYFTTRNKKPLINYGLKTIDHAISNPDNLSEYTHTKEIKKFNFFDGRITTKNFLVSMVLHEYAHYIQHLQGGYSKGSIHNSAFYAILNDLYREGYHNEVKNFLNSDMTFDKLPDYESRGNSNIENLKKSIRVGDRVTFSSRSGKTITEKVVRVNQKTVSTETYRISYNLIEEHINSRGMTSEKAKTTDSTSLRDSVKVGDFITFTSSRGKVVAKVTKLNLKTMSCSDSVYSYKVPYSMAKKANDVPQSEKPVIKDREYFSHLRVGDTIKIKSSGKIEELTVLRLNSKRATCRGRLGDCYVPYSIIID